jgi:hypothetical protein
VELLQQAALSPLEQLRLGDQLPSQPADPLSGTRSGLLQSLPVPQIQLALREVLSQGTTPLSVGIVEVGQAPAHVMHRSLMVAQLPLGDLHPGLCLHPLPLAGAVGHFFEVGPVLWTTDGPR